MVLHKIRFTFRMYPTKERQNTRQSPQRATETSSDEKCFAYLKGAGCWEQIVKTVHFVIHFLSVMVLLYIGAMVFALLEDPELFYPEANHPEKVQLLKPGSDGRQESLSRRDFHSFSPLEAS